MPIEWRWLDHAIRINCFVWWINFAARVCVIEFISHMQFTLPYCDHKNQIEYLLYCYQSHAHDRVDCCFIIPFLSCALPIAWKWAGKSEHSLIYCSCKVCLFSIHWAKGKKLNFPVIDEKLVIILNEATNLVFSSKSSVTDLKIEQLITLLNIWTVEKKLHK
jgi:hypothetical protein